MVYREESTPYVVDQAERINVQGFSPPYFRAFQGDRWASAQKELVELVERERENLMPICVLLSIHDFADQTKKSRPSKIGDNY